MPKNYNLYLKGYVGDCDFNADMVSYVLDKHKNEEVSVLISSLGGSTATALSISSLFRIHGNVHCHYVGMNASAATIASMGAKRVTMDADAMFLVHKCMVVVFEWDYMNADELDAHIAELEKCKRDNQTIDGCIAGMYAKRCRKSKDELLELMRQGAWMTATQAKDWGFVDEITNEAEDAAPELTESMACDIAAAGMPLPPMAVKRDTLLERILNALTGHRKTKTEAQADGPVTTAPSPDEKTITPMEKELKEISALLGESLYVTDGGVSLTDSQTDTIENAIAGHKSEVESLKSEIKDKDTRIAELEARVESLSKEPGATTTEVAQPKSVELDPQRVADALINIIR